MRWGPVAFTDGTVVPPMMTKGQSDTKADPDQGRPPTDMV